MRTDLKDAVESANTDALRANVEHWKARALAAELASEQKERLLKLLTDAAAREERTIMAVSLTVGPDQTISMAAHTGDPVSEELIQRWAGAIAPWLRVIDAATREFDGRSRLDAAEAEVDDDE